MSKYSFDRSNSGSLEAMTKALLPQEFGIEGELLIFGHGKDGAREATWSHPPTHPHCAALNYLGQLIFAARIAAPELARAALDRPRTISRSRVGVMDEREWQIS